MSALDPKGLEHAANVVDRHDDFCGLDGEYLAEAAITAYLATSLKGQVEAVAVKPLEWRKPDPENIQDNDDCLWVATGVGGRYGISARQLVRIQSPDNMGYLLWDADDAFSFTEHLTVEDAKAVAQADFEARIRSALSPAAPSQVEG